MRDLLDASTPKQLRPHQAMAVFMLRQSLGRKLRRVVIKGPTGFGKTLVAAKIIEGARSKGNSVIFTAPAVSLIDQTVSAFEDEGIRDIGVMQANHPRTDPLAGVQVASVQTLAKRIIPDAAMVIVDECHIHSRVIDKLMDERPDVFFVGLSATPWAKGMGLRWQDLVIPCTIGELIEKGYLSKFVTYAPDVPDLSGIKTSIGQYGPDYAEEALAELMGDAKLVGRVVETWLAKGEDRPTLCFAVNRKHAAHLAAEFQRAGVATAYVDANTDTVERGIIGRQFRRGEVRVICSVRTMTTGVDLPVSCIIDAAPTQSEMLHVQKIGRGLRVNPGTEDCLILDHAGNSLRLGLVTDIEHTTLDKTKPGQKPARKASEPKTKECANCGTIQSTSVCPVCGHERPAGQRQEDVETKDGELAVISGAVKRASKQDKQDWFSQLLWLCRERGYSDGWAAHKYREKFGVWPQRLDHTCKPITPEVSNWVKSRQIAYAAKKKAQPHVS